MNSWRRLGQVTKAMALLFGAGAIASVAYIYASGGKILSVQSGSMAPFINKGDLVNVKRVPSGEISAGDVITFINPADRRTTVTHRVVAVIPEAQDGNTIVTKGDANLGQDTPIEPLSVIGKVEHRVAYLGRGLDLLRTWPGLILLVYLPALVVVTAELKRLTAYYRDQQSYSGYKLHATAALSPVSKGAQIGVAALVLSLASVSGVRAALQSTATLTGNTISTSTTTPPTGGGDCTITNTGPGSTNTCSSTQNTSCTTNNSNNVNTTSSNDQTATSGDANSSGNTQGGSATSGSTSNSSSSSTTVTVDNQSTCP